MHVKERIALRNNENMQTNEVKVRMDAGHAHARSLARPYAHGQAGLRPHGRRSRAQHVSETIKCRAVLPNAAVSRRHTRSEACGGIRARRRVAVYALGGVWR